MDSLTRLHLVSFPKPSPSPQCQDQTSYNSSYLVRALPSNQSFRQLWQWGSMVLTCCFATLAHPGEAVGVGTEDTPLLVYGSEGDAVVRLQYRLSRLGYFSDCVTGFLGSQTQASIARFQRDYGLIADGIVGPETQAALFSSPESGTGNRVTDAADSATAEIQGLLQAWGYYAGPIDGLHGPQTDAAIRQFQADRGLVSDGIVGSLTWNALATDTDLPVDGGNEWEQDFPWPTELPPPPNPEVYQMPIDPLPLPFPPSFS